MDPHTALVTALRFAVAQKGDEEEEEETSNTMFQAFRKSMRKKLQTGLYEVELLNNLKEEKITILENLLEE